MATAGIQIQLLLDYWNFNMKVTEYHKRQCFKPWWVTRDQLNQLQAIFNFVFTESRDKQDKVCLIQGLLNCSPVPPLPAPRQMLIHSSLDSYLMLQPYQITKESTNTSHTYAFTL